MLNNAYGESPMSGTSTCIVAVTSDLMYNNLDQFDDEPKSGRDRA